MQILYTVFPYFSHKVVFEVTTDVNLVEELWDQKHYNCVRLLLFLQLHYGSI